MFKITWGNTDLQWLIGIQSEQVSKEKKVKDFATEFVDIWRCVIWVLNLAQFLKKLNQLIYR